MADELADLCRRENRKLFEKFWHETMSADASIDTPAPPPGEDPWIQSAHTRRLEELIRIRLEKFYPRLLPASLDPDRAVPWTIGLDLSMRMIPAFVRDAALCESNLEALAQVYCEKLVVALSSRQRACLGEAANLGIECRQMRLPEQDADIKSLEVHVTITGREPRANTP